MADLPWDLILAVLGVAVPVVAFLWEFVVVGEKRLGYRVQMDTVATDVAQGRYAGVLQQMRRDGQDSTLRDPSFVLLRIENDGSGNIDTHDYAVPDHDRVGVRVIFDGRIVTGMVVTELSQEHLGSSFAERSGLAMRDGTIELPRVPLNRGEHYKVLAVLERAPGNTGTSFPPPRVVGGIKGGVVQRFTGRLVSRVAGRIAQPLTGRLQGGGVEETTSHTGIPKRVIGMVVFLVLIVMGQFALSYCRVPVPLDCAKGTLTLLGSTAFRPVLDEVAGSYEKTCPGARFVFDTAGSGDGLGKLTGPGRLAFSDGPKSAGHPQALPRPIAFTLFALVAHRDVGVLDLSLEEVRRLYLDGTVPSWRDLGAGQALPVRLVDREAGSGTRTAFQKHLLGGRLEPGENSTDCRALDPGASGGVVRCRRQSTSALLDAVAGTPGAIGYSDLSAAQARGDVQIVRIGGQEPTLENADHNAYPFWETEYAYTFGEPSSDSLTASFLRYLSNEKGKDIIRSHGHRPCSELQNPVLCHPE